tara:strand:- start:431 stop:1867 length:1437 start_codon:yes stop_codon:yes gene_type:complete
METIPKTYRYVEIAQNIEHQILDGVLKLGDKLPSVRILKQEYGVSVSTILQAYYRLEAKSLVESRPRSGYYVVYCSLNVPESPIKTNPNRYSVKGTATEMIIDFYQYLSNDAIVNLSLGVPSAELLPIAKLNKTMHETISQLPAGGTYYDNIYGSIKLRRQIAQRTLLWGGNLTEDDLLITAGCTSALSLSLMAVTKPGDTVVVESPVFYGILQLANTLGLRVIELPTDSDTGIDLDALREVFKKMTVHAILLVANFNNPLGSVMPDAHKREVVRLIHQYQIPLIEDDICGDIYYGNKRPGTCKSFDKNGLVLWVGSFSKTIAGGYRVGWVAPGRYLAEVMKLKLYLSSSTATIPQETIANLLANGRYDHHLRRLRQTLHANSMKYIGAIGTYFPKDTRVSKPQGSFLLWVAFNEKIDTRELYEQALACGIMITPGHLFTLQDQYRNCMRLSYGMLWNDRIDGALKQLGTLAKAQLAT